MAQVTIYLPGEHEAELRRAAAQAGKSLSAYIAELTMRSVRPKTWPPGFLELAGSWEGSFPEIEDPIPAEIGEP